MSPRTVDAAITTAGVILGAALVGLPIGALLARRYLATPITSQPARAYSQPHAVVTSLTNLKGAKP
jgi:hypothetical protein